MACVRKLFLSRISVVRMVFYFYCNNVPLCRWISANIFFHIAPGEAPDGSLSEVSIRDVSVWIEKKGEQRMKNIEEIKRRVSALKDRIHDEYGVSNIEVFGSYVRGEQQEGSDLDVLVEFDRRVDLLDVSGLQIYLSETLGMKVDVVLKRSIRPELKDIILSEAVPV